MSDISARDLETLHELAATNRNLADCHGGDWNKGWAKPLDMGGSNGSHHNYTLQKLVRRGMVEASRGKMRNTNARPGIRRATVAGLALLDAKKLIWRKTW